MQYGYMMIITLWLGMRPVNAPCTLAGPRKKSMQSGFMVMNGGGPQIPTERGAGIKPHKQVADLADLEQTVGWKVGWKAAAMTSTLR